MAVKPVPDGYHTVTPYIVAKGVPDLLEFLKRAFRAEETERCKDPDGSVAHAEVRIGDSVVMMGEARGPHAPMPACLYLYVPDTDAVYRGAIAAGAESIQEPADQFYGDRCAGVKDRFGNQWWIGTRVEDLTKEEIERRAAARK